MATNLDFISGVRPAHLNSMTCFLFQTNMSCACQDTVGIGKISLSGNVSINHPKYYVTDQSTSLYPLSVNKDSLIFDKSKVILIENYHPRDYIIYFEYISIPWVSEMVSYRKEKYL